MASLGAAFLPPEEQNLQLTRNLGDALARVAQHVFGPHNTAKKIEAEWGFDSTKAKNTLKGVVGGVPVTQAVQAQQKRHGNGWEIWDALGEQIIGESRQAYEDRRLQTIMNEAENARKTLARRRQARAALVAISRHLDDLDDREAAVGQRRCDGGPGSPAHELGHRETHGQTPSQKGRS